MTGIRTPLYTACAAIALTLGLTTVAMAEPTAPVTLTEWDVPWKSTRPRDPWPQNDTTIWFVGQAGDYAATFNPKTEAFKRYDLEEGTGPHTVIANDKGAWYAGNRNRHIGLIEPETGDIEKIMMPGDGYGDAHTMDFTRNGDIWFTLQGANQIGFLDVDKRKVTLHDIETPSARPYGLVVNEQDRPWATLFGTHKLLTVTEKGELKEIELPREAARPRRLAIGPDGQVWYVDYAKGYLGRYNPETETIEEWRTPAGEKAYPYAMGMDHKGRPWFVETGPRPNRFVGFNPETESFYEPVPIESGGMTVRHMTFDKDTHSFWFGTDANTLGRAVVE